MPGDNPPRLDRRSTIKWMLSAVASLPLMKGQTAVAATDVPGYGRDPDMRTAWSPGELWPLSFDSASKRTAIALCDFIIPADDRSPGASAVGVPDFIDEWISAPYAAHRRDGELILSGFTWLDRESRSRFGRAFADVDAASRAAICDDICYLPRSDLEHREAARFFARYRDLTAGGFYTTPAGRKDLQYVGNVPLATFEGPPDEVLEAVGLR